MGAPNASPTAPASREPRSRWAAISADGVTATGARTVVEAEPTDGASTFESTGLAGFRVRNRLPSSSIPMNSSSRCTDTDGFNGSALPSTTRWPSSSQVSVARSFSLIQ